MKAKCNDCGTVMEFSEVKSAGIEMGLDIFCPTCNRRAIFNALEDVVTPAPDKDKLVAEIKKDIEAVANIYPTAFNLYEEPLNRLAQRIATKVLEKINV